MAQTRAGSRRNPLPLDETKKKTQKTKNPVKLNRLCFYCDEFRKFGLGDTIRSRDGMLRAGWLRGGKVWNPLCEDEGSEQLLTLEERRGESRLLRLPPSSLAHTRPRSGLGDVVVPEHRLGLS